MSATSVSAARRREVIDALRRGTVPQSGLDLFAVGLERFAPALDERISTIASGGASFHAIRGEYGSGKTFFARWLAERAKRSGLAAAEIQISETETPLHKLETVYRRLTERLTTATEPASALRSVVDGWFYTLEQEVDEAHPELAEDDEALEAAVEELLEERLRAVAQTTPAFSAALRGYRKATLTGDSATAEAGPRRLLLAGQSWQVTYIDWSRRRCFVEPVDGGGKARWGGAGSGRTASYELTRAGREVLLGADPPVTLTTRAGTALTQARESNSELVRPDGTVVVRGGRDTNVRWWTWAGYWANATLAATLTTIADPLQRPTDTCIRLREDVTPAEWRKAIAEATDQLCLPAVDARALNGLKFSAALPTRLAEATLAARLADLDGAAAALRERTRFTVLGQ